MDIERLGWITEQVKILKKKTDRFITKRANIDDKGRQLAKLASEMADPNIEDMSVIEDIAEIQDILAEWGYEDIYTERTGD